MLACAPAKRWRSGGRISTSPTVPLLVEHADALVEGRDPAPWVFASEAATPLDYAGVARRFRAILVRAKLPNHSPYDLRHTFATDLLAGPETVPAAPITYVSAQMGHANPATTLRHYAH